MDIHKIYNRHCLPAVLGIINFSADHIQDGLVYLKIRHWWKPLSVLRITGLPFLLLNSTQHSGDWIFALLIASCGLKLDDEAVRVAVGFRLASV